MNKGKLDPRALDRSVLRSFYRQREKEQLIRDGAVLGSGRIAVASKTMIYGGPYAEPLVFYQALNAALAENIRPDGVRFLLTFPLTESEEKIKEYTLEFRMLADAEGLQVLGGSTRGSASVTRPVMTVEISGPVIPSLSTEAVPKETSRTDAEPWNPLSAKRRPVPGESVLMIGNAGESGALLLSCFRRNSLKERFPAFYLEEAEEVVSRLSLTRPAEVLWKYGASMQPAGEGGVLSALYNFAEGFRLGFTVDMKAIPIAQPTVEITEALPEAIDPYALYSTGCMLAAVPEEAAKEVLEKILALGYPAARIGVVTEGPKKELLIGEHTRDLSVPEEDPIYQFPEFG